MIPRALVLAAGLGTRISPVANGLPKPLLELGGTSLLGWNLSWLRSYGIEEIRINVHHRAEQIRAAIGDGAAFGVRVEYAYEPELLGTAGAWRALAHCWHGTSLVVYGDNFMRFDLGRLLDTHAKGGARATVALFDPAVHGCTGSAGGRARVVDGRVVAFEEDCAPAPAPEPDGAAAPEPVNAGVYALEPSVAGVIPPGFQDFGRDVLPRLAAAGELVAHILEPGGFCLGMDTPERYRQAQELFAGGEVVP